MINIAYIIDTLDTSAAGSERQLLMLIRLLNKKKFSPHVIVLRKSPWLCANRVSFPVYNLDLRRLLSVKVVEALVNFRRYCTNNNIMIAQTFFRDGNLFGTVAAALSGVRTILSSRRNQGVNYWHNKRWLLLLRALTYITTGYIANCCKTKLYTAKSEHVEPKRIDVVYNGLDLESFGGFTEKKRRAFRESLGIGEDHVLVGTVANFRPVKNLPLFLEAARMVHDRHPETRFIMIGDGPERPRIEKLINDLGLKKKVLLPGRQEDVMPFLNAMDIGVLCSTSESLSNAIIEYLASGIPSVVSDAGGNVEAIGFDRGLSFKSGDCRELLDRLVILVKDGELRRSLGRAGKRYAMEMYSSERMVAAYERIYEKYALARTG